MRSAAAAAAVGVVGPVAVQQRARVEGLPDPDVRRRPHAAHRVRAGQGRRALLGDCRELVRQGVVFGIAGRRRGVSADARRGITPRDAAGTVHTACRRPYASPRQGTLTTRKCLFYSSLFVIYSGVFVFKWQFIITSDGNS